MNGGDTFSNITGSTIINRSQVQGAVTVLQQTNRSESAEALKQLADLVEKSGDADAAEYLNAFTEELRQPNPRKNILRSMWEGIQKALPSVSSMVGVATGIAALI